MEKYSGICRFILSCNYSSKIIDPIQSRCAVMRFKPLTQEDIKGYLSRIIAEEAIDIEPDALDGLVRIAHGDMRRSVNSLQVAASLGKKVDLDLIYQTAGMANPDAVKKMMETALDGNFMQARSQLDDIMVNNGLSGQDVIKQMHSSIFDLTVSDYDKVKMIDKCGEVEFRIVEGSNDRIQLEVFIAYLVMVGGKAR